MTFLWDGKKGRGISSIMNWQLPLNTHNIKKYYQKEVCQQDGNQGGTRANELRLCVSRRENMLHCRAHSHGERWQVRLVPRFPQSYSSECSAHWGKRTQTEQRLLPVLPLFFVVSKMWVIESIGDTILQLVTCCANISPLWVGIRLKGGEHRKSHLHLA